MSTPHHGEMPFAQNAFNDRRSSTFDLVQRKLADARFPSHKRDLVGRFRDETVEASNGQALKVRRILEEARRDKYESLAEVIEDIELAIDRGNEGGFAETYPPNRPHA